MTLLWKFFKTICIVQMKAAVLNKLNILFHFLGMLHGVV